MTASGFQEIVEKADPHVCELAQKAKALIAEVYPPVVEVAWPRQRIIGYGVGPKKMSEHFCYIAVLKERINLGFYYGAALPDPSGLLEGSGKSLRHIKISQAKQLEDPSLRELLEKASKYLPKLNH
jgi:hypothetical protein